MRCHPGTLLPGKTPSCKVRVPAVHRSPTSSVGCQLSARILARVSAPPRNGSRIQDLHENISHHVIFTADNFISLNLFPAAAAVSRMRNRGGQISSSRT